MTSKELDSKIKERRKRVYTKDIWFNLLLLVPPTIALIALVMFAFSTYSISLFLIYFILPMFYTVEKRIRFTVSGIGKTDFNYADGYKAFFVGSQGGIFGVISSILQGIILAILFYLIFQTFFPYICSCYPDALEVYNEFNSMWNSNSYTSTDCYNYLLTNGYALTGPLVILFGIILFVPLGYVFFFSINSNLDNHYLSTIVLPDIDQNVSASQARSLSKGSFGRYFSGTRISKTFKLNWPFYVAYTIIYAALIYSFTFASTTNFYLISIVALAGPALSIFAAVLLDYFCLANEYCVIEEGSPMVLDTLPPQMKDSIYQTYCSSHYIHGEESARRGSFVPGPTYQEQHPFNSPFENNNTYSSETNSYQSTDDINKTPTDTKESDPTGVVIDLSKNDNKDDKKDKK